MGSLETASVDVLRRIMHCLSPCQIATLASCGALIRRRLFDGGGVSNVCHVRPRHPDGERALIPGDATPSYVYHGGDKRCACLLKSIPQIAALCVLTVDATHWSLCDAGWNPGGPPLSASLEVLRVSMPDSIVYWLEVTSGMHPIGAHSLADMLPNLRRLKIVMIGSDWTLITGREEDLATEQFLKLTTRGLPNTLEAINIPSAVKVYMDQLPLPAACSSIEGSLLWRRGFTLDALPPRLHFLSLEARGGDDATSLVEAIQAASTKVGGGRLSSLRTLGLVVRHQGAPVAQSFSPRWAKCLPRSLLSLTMVNPAPFEMRDLPPLLSFLQLHYTEDAEIGDDNAGGLKCGDDMPVVDFAGWRPLYLETLRVSGAMIKNAQEIPRSVTSMDAFVVAQRDECLPVDCALRSIRLPNPVQWALPAINAWPHTLTDVDFFECHVRVSVMSLLPSTIVSLSAAFAVSKRSDWSAPFAKLPLSLRRLVVRNRDVAMDLFRALRASKLEHLEFSFGMDNHTPALVIYGAYKPTLQELMPPLLHVFKCAAVFDRLNLTTSRPLLTHLYLPGTTFNDYCLKTTCRNAPSLRVLSTDMLSLKTIEETSASLWLSHPHLVIREVSALLWDASHMHLSTGEASHGVRDDDDHEER